MQSNGPAPLVVTQNERPQTRARKTNFAHVQNWFTSEPILHMCKIDFSRASLRALVLCHNKESRAVVLCIVHTHSDVSLENLDKLGYNVRFFPLYRITEFCLPVYGKNGKFVTLENTTIRIYS